MMMLKIVLYASCVATCLACTILLVRRYVRQRTPLLLWSAVCFVGLTVSNALLVVDLLILPDMDLRIIRLGAATIGMVCLIGAFVWEVST